jgi:hypothetical protein
MSKVNPAAALENCTAVLSGALTVWATRDDSKAQPDVRQAANTAMAAIDTMLAELHAARSVLVGEIRASDDAFGARVDAMLAARGGHPFVRPGQVAPDCPAPDQCVSCGQPEAAHCGGAR